MTKPFYLDDNCVIRFPKREIYNQSDHKTWFADENIPLLGTIRGYMTEEHIICYVNNYEIPPLHPTVIASWFEMFPSLRYVNLGLDSDTPQLTIFKGDTVNFHPKEEQISESNVIQEADELNKKDKVGF